MSPAVELDRRTYERLRLVAAVLGKSESSAVAHLIDELQDRIPEPESAFDDVPVHAIYAGERVEGLFQPRSQELTITTGPLKGQKYDRPSPAARAVVESINPSVDSHRNGWTFWTVTSTNEELQTVR